MNECSTNSLKHRLRSGGAWAVMGRVFTVFFSLVTNMLLARLLSPENMGLYFLLFSFVSIAVIIGQFGFNQVVVRFVADALAQGKHVRAREILNISVHDIFVSLSVVAFLTITGGASIVAKYIFHSSLTVGAPILLGLWVFLLGFQRFFAEYFRALHNIRLASLLGTVLPGALFSLLLLCLWLAKKHADIDLIMILACTATLFTGVLSWRITCSERDRLDDQQPADTKIHEELLAAAWPLMLINLMVFVLTQADLWIAGMYCSADDVAIYGAASRLALLMLLITSLMQAFLPPLIAQYHSLGDQLTLQRILQTGAFINTVLVLPGLLVFFLWGDDILALLFGAHYAAGGNVLLFLSLGLFVNVMTGMRGYVLMMTGHERDQMIIAVVGGLLNILSCISGALYAGIAGIAVGAMIAMIVQCLAEVCYVRYRLHIWTWLSADETINLYREMRNT